MSSEELAKLTHEQELEHQEKTIELSVGMTSVSLLRFVSDHINDMSLGVARQIMEEDDILMVLVVLMEQKPWIAKNNKGQRMRFENQKWEVIPPGEFNKVPKMEAQVLSPQSTPKTRYGSCSTTCWGRSTAGSPTRSTRCARTTSSRFPK